MTPDHAKNRHSDFCRGLFRRSVRWAPVLLFLLALYLRTAGLSHDLHLGNVYHPDTPKQIRAADQFLAGLYHAETGHPDYDGYPYFNSHLVALLARTWHRTQTCVRAHLGLPYEPFAPSLHALYWMTRLLNAFLSALAVLVLYAMGTRFWNRRAGQLAALLLALSPADITAAHFAMGDTTAAFLALVAVYFALRAYQDTRVIHYALGGLFAAASFSAKYQGAMVLTAFLAAHLARYPLRGPAFSTKSIRRGLTLIGVFIAGVFGTTPALLVRPRVAFQQILQFIDHTSGYGMRQEIADMNLFEQFIAGLRMNLPVFIDILGPIAAIAALIGLILEFRKRRMWILAIVPIVYLFVGLTLKPLAHPTYHTFVTPMMFLAAAVAFVRPFESANRRRTITVPVLACAVLSILYLGDYARRELFFFRHNDTRRVAETWAHDNIPPAIFLDARAYTFPNDHWRQGGKDRRHRAFVFARDLRETIATGFRMHDVRFETHKLTPFRNWPVRFFMRDSDLIREGFHPPPFQPIPASRIDNMIPVDAPTLYRNPRVLDVLQGQRYEFILVSPEKLDHIHVLAGTRIIPARIKTRMGGHRHHLTLGNRDTRLITIDHPRPVRMRRNPNYFYRCSIRVPFGTARVMVLTTPREKAWATFYEGEYARAYDALQQIPCGERGPAEEAIRFISGLLTGNMDAPDARRIISGTLLEKHSLNTAEFFDLFGVAETYLRDLPYYAFTFEDFIGARIDLLADDEPVAARDLVEMDEPYAPQLEWHTPFMTLEPGAYIARIRTTDVEARGSVRVLDPFGRVFGETVFTTGAPTNVVDIPFIVSRPQEKIRVHLATGESIERVVKEIGIRPDPVTTMNAWLRLLDGLIREQPPETLHPLFYRPYLFLGNRLAAENRPTEAFEYYDAARRADPARLTPYREIERLRGRVSYSDEEIEDRLTPYRAVETHLAWYPAHATFRNHIRLTGFRRGDDPVRPGDSFPLNVYWQPLHLNQDLHRIGVWVHFIDRDTGATAFQGDHRFAPSIRYVSPHDRNQLNHLTQNFRHTTALFLNPDPDHLRIYFHRVNIPAHVAPGTYQIKVGLWIPPQRRILRVLESDLPHDRRGVFLGEILVEE